MKKDDDINRPTKAEQKIAIDSFQALSDAIDGLKTDSPEIEIQETTEKIKVPVRALKLLARVLKAMSKGKPISIVPVATEVTTQKAAEVLGCSRPHIVSLLEEGKIDYTKVGKHRRVKLEDVLEYKKEMKRAQKQKIIEIMKADEESGLYDS